VIDYFIPLLIAITIAFWIYRTYDLLKLIKRVDDIKSWPSAKASLEWYHVEGETKDGKFKLFRSIINKIIGTEKYHFFAKFDLDGLTVGASNFTVFKKMKASHRLYARSIMRSRESVVDVYYDPQNPMDSVFLPPSMHKLRGDIVKHILATVILNYAIVVMVTQ